MQGQRYQILDSVRGFTVLSMVLYHACWDLVHLTGRSWGWFQTAGAYVWQQSICWVFIFLAGLCFNLGRRHVRRGLKLLLLGSAITAVTLFFLPQDPIIFGILFFLGAATLLTSCLAPLLLKIPAAAGLGVSAFLFAVLRNVNDGALGFAAWHWLPVPAAWYELGSAGAFLGFTPAGFRSADYFSLLPWFFLYLAGYFTGRIWLEQQREEVCAEAKVGVERQLAGGRAAAGSTGSVCCRSLQFLGRHALAVYISHQPILLAGLWLLGSGS